MCGNWHMPQALRSVHNAQVLIAGAQKVQRLPIEENISDIIHGHGNTPIKPTNQFTELAYETCLSFSESCDLRCSGRVLLGKKPALVHRFHIDLQQQRTYCSNNQAVVWKKHCKQLETTWPPGCP